MNILVLSTYDIAPVQDGGQTRYFNIYRHVAERHRVTILAYDFRRDADRGYFLAEQLKVVAPRCSAEDRSRFDALVARTGRHMHDLLCIRQHRFSPEFYAALRREAVHADVVVASHPYLAPVGFGFCPDRTVKVYEAHNVEYDAKLAYFVDDPDRVLVGLLEDVWQAERLASVEADYVTAVSDADADRLAELYRIPRRKIATVPNGVDVGLYPRVRDEDKTVLHQALGATRPLAVFLGSGHAPNVDAYLRGRAMLDEAGFGGLLVSLGSIRQGLPDLLPPVSFEESFLGFTDESVRAAVLGAADFALQLVFSGSGTNLKVFDYMAARRLIVANAFGRRGIPFDGWYWPVENAADLARFLREEPWQAAAGTRLGERARQIAETHYDWRRIAASYDRLLTLGRGPMVAEPPPTGSRQHSGARPAAGRSAAARRSRQPPSSRSTPRRYR